MGSMNVLASGAWRKAKGAHVFAGGAWRKAKAVWVFSGGAWRKMSFDISTTISIGSYIVNDFPEEIIYGFSKHQTGSVNPEVTEWGSLGALYVNDPIGGVDKLIFQTTEAHPAVSITITGFGTVNFPAAGPFEGRTAVSAGVYNFFKNHIGQNISVVISPL